MGTSGDGPDPAEPRLQTGAACLVVPLESGLITDEPAGTMASMSRNEIDEYLDAVEEPKRSTLTHLRDTIMAIVPEAEQCISYGMPAFRVRGNVVAGFAAFK